MALNLYEIQIRDESGVEGFASEGDVVTGVLAKVYVAGTKTAATLYKDANQTALANPITRAQFAIDGMLRFYTGEASVDIFVADSKGSVKLAEALTVQSHVIVLPKSTSQKVFAIPFAASNAVEVDTGIDLPVGLMVEDVLLDVTATDATETIDVGLLSSESGGDANGFLALAPVDTAGIVQGIGMTTGTNETYISAVYFGALFSPKPVVGTDVDGDSGSFALGRKVITTAVSVTYTGSAGSDTAAGMIYIIGRHIK